MAKTPPAWLLEILAASDPEARMRDRIAAVIDAARPSRGWAPGRPLNLLLLGYSGAGNIGADIRVLETIRQIRALLGPAVQLRVTVVGAHIPADGFHGVPPLPLSSDLAGFLDEAGRAYDGVIVTEGSLFTSTFSDTLAAALAGGLGVFSAQEKLSVGYGSEAGAMSDAVAAFATRYCRESLVLCRNEPSRQILAALGLRAESGTDTAWTFAPANSEAGPALLDALGWDGASPVCVMCPVNPFWWPVRPDPVRFRALQERGEFKDQQYLSIFFHHDSAESRRRYDVYGAGLARAIDVLVRDHAVFPVLVGMEPLDRRVCEDVSGRCASPLPILCSGDHPADTIVSVLRSADLLISSRFHAIVASMAAQPLTVGVSMDGRIVNLMNALGRPDLAVRADAPDLSGQVIAQVRAALADGDAIRAAMRVHVAGEIQALGRMGLALVAEIARVCPGAEPAHIPADGLPPLAPALYDVLEGA